MKNALTPLRLGRLRPLAGRLAHVRRRPPPARRGRAHAPRLRRPTRPNSRPGRPPTGSSPPRSITRRWPLGRARCRQKGSAPRTMARKLAAPRASSARCSSTARSPPTRPTCCPPPSSPRCRATLKPADVAALLDRIPAATPLEQRDRALFELAYACGLRAEELVDLDVGSSTSTPSRCASRARAARPASSPPASPP